MSSPQRRRERQAEWEREREAQEAEQHRVDNLCIFSLLSEAKDVTDLKAVIERVAKAANVDIFENGAGA